MKIDIRPFFYLLVIVIINSCDSNEPVPPKPPGYQDDIPWPSLADSPWPMNHGDPQSTGRSKYIGPMKGIIVGKIEARELENSIVIGKNKTLYFSPTHNNSSLYAVDYSGNKKWDIPIKSGEINMTPLIDSENNIYFYSELINNHGLYKADTEGNILWSRKDLWTFSLGMNIGKDGTIYLMNGSRELVALSNEGEILWKYSDTRFNDWTPCVLVFSPDGETLYINNCSYVTLIAFSLKTQTIKWEWGTQQLYNNPLVDSDGNIYIFPSTNSTSDKKFYCLKPDGTIKWEYTHNFRNDKYLNLDPTMDKNGNIYFGYTGIYSLTYEGKMRWKYELFDSGNFCPLVCDIGGNLYAGLVSNKVICLDENGNLRWEVEVDAERSLGFSPAISEDGTLFYPTFRSKEIFIIK